MIILNDIRSYGETVGDKIFVEKIHRRFPTKFDSLVVAIEESNSKYLTQILVDGLMGSFLAHEKILIWDNIIREGIQVLAFIWKKKTEIKLQ